VPVRHNRGSARYIKVTWKLQIHAPQTESPETVLPDRALCLPTFSHVLIVNKTSLTLSLSGFMNPWSWY
jgi:hypothetical protein